MELIIFILAICICILFNNFYNLKKESRFIKSILEKYSAESAELKKEIADLKNTLQGKTITSDPIITKEEVKATIIEPIQEKIIEDIIPQYITSKEQTIDTEIPSEPIAIIEELPKEELPKPIIENISTVSFDTNHSNEEKVYTESAFSKFIKKAEKQFADNWTGILGTAIMVLGIGYLSIYTALKVAPLFRVLILWLYAGLLVGSYYFLHKKEKWNTTGLWLRSAGASLFLFGCFGASQIPALSFISNPISSYLLIGLGIGLNLFVGYIIKRETFLSLHVILSILILCVIPEKTLATIILASITASIGIILSYKEKWEYHLLIVIVAFIIFDIWFNAQGTTLTATENIIAIIGIIAVAVSCMYMQYRNFYENTFFDKAGFITHLTNWILFATGLILHATGSKFKTIILFIGAILCFFISLKAKKKKIYWLYHLDGMVSFTLLSLSVIMLNDWNVGIDIIACILYSIIVVCLFIVHKEKETLLTKIFLGINHIAALALLFFLSLITSNSLSIKNTTNLFATTITLSILSIAVPVYTAIKNEFENIDAFILEKKLSLNGLLAVACSLFVIIKSDDVLMHHLYIVVSFGVALIWCVLKQLFDKKTFDLGRMLFYLLSITTGILILHSQVKSNYDWMFSIGILLIIAYNWNVKQFFNNDFIIRCIGIVGANLLSLVLIYKYLPQHQIVQIFSLFGLALANHEFLWINFKKNTLCKDNQPLLYVFYYLSVAIGSVLLIINASDFPYTQIALCCTGISVIELYVLFAKRIRNNSEDTIKEWTNLNFLNSEFLVLNALIFSFSCIQFEYISVVLAGFAILKFIGFEKLSEFKRFNKYSFGLLIGSIVMSLYVAVSELYEANKTIIYLTQTATVLLSLVYSYLQYISKQEKTKRFQIILPYIQNIWIVLLIFIQVDLSYLPLLLMVLALLNYWLITNNKIKIAFQFIPLIALLAIVFSVYYSLDKLNNFNAIDWLLQLGSVALGIVLAILLNKRDEQESVKPYYEIVLNGWLSLIMFTQLEHKWLPVFWAITAIVNLFLFYKKIGKEKNISIVYYLLANLHLGIVSFNFYESKFLFIYLLIFALLAVYLYLAYKWMESFSIKNSLLIYPATLSIGCFLYLTFDKGILTFFWILEALGLLILGILLKEKYFRYVSLSLVGLCVVRLMFFDLSNADFLIRALVLLGVGVVLLVMNSLFKKYKDRFD